MRTLPIFLFLSIFALLNTSCYRNRDEVWDDTKTCGRHMYRGVKSLGGKHGDSRQVHCRSDFESWGDGTAYMTDFDQLDYVPIMEEQNLQVISTAEARTPQPREVPGDPGCNLPGIEAFKDPASNPSWAAVFRNVNFALDSDLVKGQGNRDTLRYIADYMKNNRNIYVFVEGHCDERGAEAYNLALGARRSNAVRNLLIREGISPDHIFTISYGTERPLSQGHNESAWTKNRRAQFRVLQY